jgi:hypothetical protein
MYKEAKLECEKAHDDSSLKIRLLYKLDKKLGDENETMNLHGRLENTIED